MFSKFDPGRESFPRCFWGGSWVSRFGPGSNVAQWRAWTVKDRGELSLA
jgi:hypothetical protein